MCVMRILSAPLTGREQIYTRGRLTLCTELPRGLILGNSYSYARIPIRYRGVCKRACSAGFLEELFSETGLPPNDVLGISAAIKRAGAVRRGLEFGELFRVDISQWYWQYLGTVFRDTQPLLGCPVTHGARWHIMPHMSLLH